MTYNLLCTCDHTFAAHRAHDCICCYECKGFTPCDPWRKQCVKCGFLSGDDWTQCHGKCPMPGSPYFSESVAAEYGGKFIHEYPSKHKRWCSTRWYDPCDCGAEEKRHA